MIEYLKLKNVGPALEMRVHWAKRLNLITGDNGLGKSFLLDLAWWALTRTWANAAALPMGTGPATIEYAIKGTTGSAKPVVSSYKFEESTWPLKQSRPSIPGIVVYIRVDGGFSVWDPARNYWRTDKDRPLSYQFNADDVWNGLDLTSSPP